MIVDDGNGLKFNRFPNLDGIEDRIIYYLISPNNKTPEELKQTHIIWKLLKYDENNALLQPTPEYSDIVKLISKPNAPQTTKRIFRSPHFEDAWGEQSTLLKVYIDDIVATNAYYATVNMGIDIIVHNKIVDLDIPDDDDSTIIDVVDGVEYKITTKSRVSVLTKAILYLLNGANVAGVGLLQFNNDGTDNRSQAQYGIWNNRNFEGIKIVIGVGIGGVS